MKKRLVFLGMLAIALAIGFAFVSCDEEDSDPFEGTWEGKEGPWAGKPVKLTLSGGNFTIEYDGKKESGTYTTDLSDLPKGLKDSIESQKKSLPNGVTAEYAMLKGPNDGIGFIAYTEYEGKEMLGITYQGEKVGTVAGGGLVKK
ncbi:MAG: hypothetical protein LBH44_09510 [Treponema sp.]|jgi:hypothetical protein|nr:hypothetical protein [Treponema sp.]